MHTEGELCGVVPLVKTGSDDRDDETKVAENVCSAEGDPSVQAEFGAIFISYVLCFFKVVFFLLQVGGSSEKRGMVRVRM